MEKDIQFYNESNSGLSSGVEQSVKTLNNKNKGLYKIIVVTTFRVSTDDTTPITGARAYSDIKTPVGTLNSLETSVPFEYNVASAINKDFHRNTCTAIGLVYLHQGQELEVTNTVTITGGASLSIIVENDILLEQI